MLLNNQVIDSDNNIKAKEDIKIINKLIRKTAKSADLRQGQYIHSSNTSLHNMLGCFVNKAPWLWEIKGQRSTKCNDLFLGTLLNTSWKFQKNMFRTFWDILLTAR